MRTPSLTGLADLFWEQGFLHLENFFEEGEIVNCAHAMQKANELSGDRKWNQWAGQEAVQAMLFSEKVLRLAAEILGEVPVFFGRVLETYQTKPLSRHVPVGHSSFQELTKSVPRILHTDAKGTEERLFAERSKMPEHRYPVIRFSHYFQDHSRYSYGIKVAPGSHHDGDPDNITTLLHPPLKPCDLLLLNLKTVHSAKCLLHRSGQVFTPKQEDELEITAPHEFYPSPVTRNVIFWDFCTMSRIAELFIRNRAFSELGSWPILGSQLDAIPKLQRLADRGDLILRYDTEISLLRGLEFVGRLSDSSRERLQYLERISSHVVPLVEDMERFAPEFEQAVGDSKL